MKTLKENSQELSELLTKVAKAPGLCTRAEIKTAYFFYNEFKIRLEIFRAAQGRDPVGFTVDSILKDLTYYTKEQQIKTNDN